MIRHKKIIMFEKDVPTIYHVPKDKAVVRGAMRMETLKKDRYYSLNASNLNATGKEQLKMKERAICSPGIIQLNCLSQNKILNLWEGSLTEDC